MAYLLERGDPGLEVRIDGFTALERIGAGGFSTVYRATDVRLGRSVAVKVLAPGFYARQDMRTPVLIGIAMLVATQLMNFFFVPRLGHAGLALSIGIAALFNALLLLIGLVRRGIYVAQPGLRIALLAGALAGAALVYFVVLVLLGVSPRQFVRRS